MFQSRYSLILCQQIMEIEEATLSFGADRLPLQDVLPPESSRIYHINFPPISASRDGREVNFLTKPKGITELWRIRTDYLNVNSLELLRRFDVNGTQFEDHITQPSRARCTLLAIVS